MTLYTPQIIRDSADSMNSAGVLLRELIDYAGLFPPASLSMAETAANYDGYTRWDFGWILGRFIVPVSRLAEFEAALAGLSVARPETVASRWHLSVLLGADAVADVASICEFNARTARLSSGRSAVIDTIEVKAAGVGEIARLSAIIPEELLTYFEISPNGWDDCIAAVAGCGRRAKIRTGGETADKIPAPASVVEFIRLCAASNVPFKATAGLHHPVRSVHRLTYRDDSPSSIMHGFLNVFLAAGFLRLGMEPVLAVQLLEEQSPEAFRFDLKGVAWRGHQLRLDELAAVRRDFAISFGACSFSEPIDDLRSLQLV